MKPPMESEISGSRSVSFLNYFVEMFQSCSDTLFQWSITCATLKLQINTKPVVNV